jgi:hypothetical protein
VAAHASDIMASMVFAAHTVVGIGVAAAALGSCPATAMRWAAERVSERRYARARGRGGGWRIHHGAGPGHDEPHGVACAR